METDLTANDFTQVLSMVLAIGLPNVGRSELVSRVYVLLSIGYPQKLWNIPQQTETTYGKFDLTKVMIQQKPQTVTVYNRDNEALVDRPIYYWFRNS